ncbi:MAG: hypothetical protein K2K47_09975 [Duncaniella sp.]|nr:hypothetical protein [Duncaniella sp.]
MNPLRLIRDAVIRYRRTRGFGVHSPFAYGFITQVLGCRYPFYCWDELEAEVRHVGEMRWRDARALFRTLNQMSPSVVYVAADVPAVVTRVIEKWSGSCKITADSVQASFLIAGDEAPVDIDSVIKSGKTVFFTTVKNPGWTSLNDAMKRGQSFTNSVTGIAICNEKLPRHYFEISY